MVMTQKTFILFIYCLFINFLLNALFIYQSKASVDPTIQWKVIDTEHFRVIYPEHLEENGQLYSRYAEQAYDELLPIFKEAPQKTLLLLNDSTDVVNGFASFFPYPIMVLYLNLPSPQSDIAAYDNWIYMLMLHEYAHILNIHPAHGFYLPFKYIFGNVIRPNGLLPRWYLEGLAVELESRLTRKGRLKSAITDAQLRTLVKENLLRKEKIDQINQSNIPNWPGGRRPYLLGSVLMQKILNFNNQPDENIYYLNQRYARRLPFFINGPVEDLIGYSWQESLDNIYSKIEEAANYQIKSIEQGKQKDFNKFPFAMDSQLNPAISPDGKKLAFIAGDYHDGFGIYLHTFSKKGRIQKVFSGNGIDKISWLPDSSGFVFSRQQNSDHFNYYSELYLYQLEIKKVKQLTNKARALEPEVSTDGQFVYFIQSGASRSALARYSFATSHIEILWQTPLNERLYHPTVIGNNQIVVGLKGSQLGQRLLLYNDLTDEKVPLLLSFDSIYNMKATKKGLFFISDKSGAPNLYLTNKAMTQAKALTNSTTAILSGDYSPANNKLIISQLSKQGPQLFFTNKLEEVDPVSIPPLLSSPLKRQKKYIQSKLNRGDTIEEIDKLKVYENQPYSSSDYLLPRYWIPFIYPVENGVLVQAITSASDPLGKQGYALNLSYDSLSQAMSGAFNYQNQMTKLRWNLGYGLFNEFRNSTGKVIQTQSANMNTNFFLSSDNAWLGSVGGFYAQTEQPNRLSLKRLAATAGVIYSSQGHNKYQPRDNELSASAFFQKFFDQEGFIAYERIFSNLRWDIKKPLKTRHVLATQLVNSYAHNMDLLDSLFIGDTNLGANFFTNLVNSSFLLRGYPTGTYVGRSMSVLNLEYSFPIWDIHQGYKTAPFFTNEILASVFIDALTVDGAAFNAEAGSYFRKRWGNDFFASTGTELVLNTTLGYHLPAFFKLGIYYGFDMQYQGGTKYFLSFGFGQFEPIGQQESSQVFYR